MEWLEIYLWETIRGPESDHRHLMELEAALMWCLPGIPLPGE